MNRTLLLIIGILASMNVVYSFFGNLTSEKMFGFEINIWIYRLIWTVISVIIFNDYFKRKKVNK